MEDINPLQLALRYDPPTIVLIYELKATGKKRQRSFHVDDLVRTSPDVKQRSADEIVSSLRQKYPTYMTHPRIKTEQVC